VEKQAAKFNLLCVYSHTLSGRLYTKEEKAAKAHIQSFSGLDRVGEVGRIRHDMAYLQCIEHIYVYWDYIDTCTLYMYESGKEISIGYWNKANFSEHSLCQLILEEKEAHVLCVGFK
jgi:hypothetical protein